MKKFLFLISLTLITATSFGQWIWAINFEDTTYLNRVFIDTISNPNCTWQIGYPAKTVFNFAYSNPNVIVTDTLNSIPPNDTSIFYLYHVRDQYQPAHDFGIEFKYQLDGDSTDKGIIEISPDTGHTWINLLTQDTTFQMHWYYPKPTLTGSTSGWQSFGLGMVSWASGYGTFPIYITADTVLFRFTYISDSISTPHDGWMIDNFLLHDVYMGIDEIQNDNLISIYPNPTSDELIIQRTNANDRETVQILNPMGQQLYENKNFEGKTINTRQLSNGIYLLKYSNAKSFSIKKFIVNH
jgi:hypothetical protein